MKSVRTVSRQADEIFPYDYSKYHGLGNDYLVMEPGRFRERPAPAMIASICDRRFGVGADGVLLGPLDPGKPGEPAAGTGPETHALRIFNPDGSEAGKSGNGLRIFARYLWDRGYVTAPSFFIHPPGGLVRARMVTPDAGRVAVEMGRVTFQSEAIPMSGPAREVLREGLSVGGVEYAINGANIGNPHCVVLTDRPSAELAKSAGPGIERHPSFPDRANVQFMQVLDAHAIRIEIWERGAGYTLASGTSSCAAAAVACRLGLCSSPVSVHMPGGVLEIRLDETFQVELEGAVEAVASGSFAEDFRARLGLVRA